MLERRGRFLTAAPLFPPRESADGPRPRGGQPVVVRAGGARGEVVPPRGLVLDRTPPPRPGARVLRRIGRPDVARDVIEALMLDRGLSRAASTARVEREAQRAAGHAEGRAAA